MISLNQFTIKKTATKDNTATFEIGPLPKGYGFTFGSYLRRVLLSSIPGAAITGMKIDGVQHEYSTLDGLTDDVLTLILSLKNVVVISKTLNPVTLEIDVKGKEGQVVEVKASDIQVSSEVEVINPDYVIAKLTSGKSRLKAQLTVERGVGYKLADSELRKEIGVLPTDASFSPVKLVKYSISPTRVGQETELDQLNITVQTSGAILPEEALNIASDILDQMTKHLLEMSTKMLKGDEIAIKLNEQQKVEDTKATSMIAQPTRNSLKISDMALSTRLTNALIKAGISDLNKLEGMTEEEIANIRGMGSKSYTELIDILKKHAIKLI
jgi:DNA-directed RNA polymerase subunit alpha